MISLRFKGGNSNTTLPLPSCTLSSFPRSSQLGFLYFCSVFSGFQLWHSKSSVKCLFFLGIRPMAMACLRLKIAAVPWAVCFAAHNKAQLLGDTNR